MILPIPKNGIIPAGKAGQVPVRDHDKPVNNKPVISRIDTERGKTTQVPRDQVGKCDHLIASYWG